MHRCPDKPTKYSGFDIIHIVRSVNQSNIYTCVYFVYIAYIIYTYIVYIRIYPFVEHTWYDLDYALCNSAIGGYLARVRWARPSEQRTLLWRLLMVVASQSWRWNLAYETNEWQERWFIWWFLVFQFFHSVHSLLCRRHLEGDSNLEYCGRKDQISDCLCFDAFGWCFATVLNMFWVGGLEECPRRSKPQTAPQHLGTIQTFTSVPEVAPSIWKLVQGLPGSSLTT